MDLFFASGLKPIWVLEQMYAQLMLSLGLVKGALDVFLKLKLWEEVIACYNIINLKHKAIEIIHQELSKKPSVQLWCLLGDATEDPNHYETAWKLSNEKSSIVQRHWGFFYFKKQNYKEAIPHLKLSVELNNIQEHVWIRLGFAALETEDWKLAVTAYKHYCALEQTVRVNAVNPGVITTNLHRNSGMSDEELKNFYEHCKNTHALGRSGDVNEVAKAIAYLASDDASFITGVTLSIDGGRHVMCPR
ncbi:hypothetical protein HZU67_07930 [Apis mellifera carnica]|nr:hypothetical protein HZU67_07930 [Apis mellifera carnica]